MINIVAKSGMSILAVAVVLTIINGITLNSQSIINTGIDMFWGVLFAIVLTTAIAKLARIL